jgi:sialate O-acetylesterase
MSSMKPLLFMSWLCASALGAFAACLLPGSARADVKLPGIFCDHMVFQQEAALPVWGWANPREKVVVTFANEKAETTAGSEGKWRVDLPALPPGTPAGTLTVAATNTITIHDVLVGEIWLCSGQSNMELPLTKTDDAAAAAAQANDPQLRICMVPCNLALAPRDDISPVKPGADIWEVCTPETVGKFSAVGYYFGRNLRASLKCPVGLIDASWGGTAAQVWTDPATLESDPAFHHYVEEQQKVAAKYPGGDKDFAAQIAAQTRPGEKPGALLSKRGFGPTIPSGLFNAMINPIIPFALNGVIWYQGEDNASPSAALEYAKLFPAMITGWRTLWKQGDFPFLYVQLANLAQRYRDNWPLVREAQFKTLSLPKTGMAVTIDIGTPYFIHPPDKADVGLRLSLLARHIAYGENIVCSGPLYDSIKVDGAKIRISFKPDTIGGGLEIGHSPWKDPKAKPPPSTIELQGFMIAGQDRKWTEAKATVDGDTVVVSNPQVPQPMAVRYAWAQNPLANLYNRNGLPASPFRTDDWNPKSSVDPAK